MEERFDDSRWSLRWERKGSTRGTERERRLMGVVRSYGGFPAAAIRTHSRSGCSVGLDLMLLSSTRPAAENGGAGVRVGTVWCDRNKEVGWSGACSLSGRPRGWGCNVTTLNSPTPAVNLQYEIKYHDGELSFCLLPTENCPETPFCGMNLANKHGEVCWDGRDQYEVLHPQPCQRLTPSRCQFSPQRKPRLSRVTCKAARTFLGMDRYEFVSNGAAIII